jgi:hypothetical protein
MIPITTLMAITTTMSNRDTMAIIETVGLVALKTTNNITLSTISRSINVTSPRIPRRKRSWFPSKLAAVAPASPATMMTEGT